MGVAGATAGGVGSLFFPLDTELRLGTEGYSPSLLYKIEWAGANAGSFGQARQALEKLAELKISSKHVQRITERLGGERQYNRDQEVREFRAGRLKPKYKESPATVAVHLDAGKIQMRNDDGAPGVRGPHWCDTKVGCLATYPGVEYDHDPHPTPPAVFLNQTAVKKLCSEMDRGDRPAEELEAGEVKGASQAESHPEAAPPRPRVVTAVATLGHCEEFGWQVAAEAQRRGFYEAGQKAIVGDGGNWIEPLGQLHFPGFTQVLDFIHLLVHLYAAACCVWGQSCRRAWGLYEKLLRSAWAGKIGEVLQCLEHHQERLGHAPPGAPEADPRRRLERVIAYVRQNAARMDYPRYRQAGLPTTSTLVESKIKQFNARVKGTDKFWIGGGAEAILQSRAAFLSQDNRDVAHYGARPLARAAGAGRRRGAA